MTGASPDIMARVATFRAGIEKRRGISVSAIYHPDLDETWLHLRSLDGRLTTVAFCDDDPEGVYVIVRRPESRPKLAQGSDEDILARITTDLASWPTP